MNTPRLVISTPERLLRVSTLHAVAKLFADDQDIPTPEAGKLYVHGLTANELLAQARRACTLIRVQEKAASTGIPLATRELHSIELELVLFGPLTTPDLERYGAHNRQIEALQKDGQ